MKYKDPTVSIQDRVQDLIDRMTIEEKIGQLMQPFGWQAYEKKGAQIGLSDSFKEQIAQGGIGSLYGVLRADPWTKVTLETGLTVKEGAEITNEMQKYAIENTRLGIPILFGEECSHGHMAIGGTVFPVPLTAASTWNAQLYEDMCRVIAKETRAQGGAATYSPVLDVVRDPRWGRTEETYGEDAFFNGEFAVAAVRGLQGERLDADDAIVATLKHFVAYGSPEGGRNGAPAHIGNIELREKDMYPFELAVKAGAQSIMTAYNEIDGVPCTSNRELLTDILRNEWGFDGFVITDCGAMSLLHQGHYVAENLQIATKMALTAGVDMEMSGELFKRQLRTACDSGLVDQETLDLAVSRVLNVKFKLGLFERPYVDPDQAELRIGIDEHIQLAKQVAEEGVVLLKNEHDALPLSSTLKKLAVIGPNANNMYNQLGDYTSPQKREQVVTILDGVRQLVGDNTEVLYAKGCSIKEDSRDGFAEAIEAARQADAAVVVLGGSSTRDFGEDTINEQTGAAVINANSGQSDMECGEGFDRAALNLLGVQLELVKEIRKVTSNLIVVYINGRPISEPWLVEHADAILEAWYPGQEGGSAIADILFGHSNPSGKLTISIPKDVGQLPVYYNSKRTRGHRYVEMDHMPQYPFGYGLSYTQFAYSDLEISRASMGPADSCQVSVKVTNTGKVAGKEVVQLYVTDLFSSVTRPERELKGFKKVHIEAGETVTVVFDIGEEQLQMVTRDLKRVVEPGRFMIRVGGDSQCTLSVDLEILAN
ncbi:glycoside hydrolase family 3 N-terminal domain-containing protein [Paenibacillus marinisediminis]